MPPRPIRREALYELARLLAYGPKLSGLAEPKNGAQAEAHVRLWLDTWIIPNACRLVPELREQIEKHRRPAEVLPQPSIDEPGLPL